MDDEKGKDECGRDPLQDRPQVLAGIELHPAVIPADEHADHAQHRMQADRDDKRNGGYLGELGVVVEREIGKNVIADVRDHENDRQQSEYCGEFLQFHTDPLYIIH